MQDINTSSIILQQQGASKYRDALITSLYPLLLPILHVNLVSYIVVTNRIVFMFVSTVLYLEDLLVQHIAALSSVDIFDGICIFVSQIYLI